MRQGLRALNEKLEQVVLPLYYSYSNDPGGWIKVDEGRDQQERLVLQ